MSDTILDESNCKSSLVPKLEPSPSPSPSETESSLVELKSFIEDETLKIVEAFEEISKQKKQQQPEQKAEREKELELDLELEQKLPEKEELKTKAKKCVTFNPNDEKIRKFTTGEPIVDQQNPFKNGHIAGGGGGAGGGRETRKIPPPVPTKRSTLSVRKTVTQQLREREREKEKERERERDKEKLREQLKNEVNTRKKNAATATTPDEYVTTEEVLKQSKYVKTYIKNPDPYFVYDPTVLARLKFEELRDIAGKLPAKRKQLPATQQQQQRKVDPKKLPQQEANNNNSNNNSNSNSNSNSNNNKPKTLAFKKCSKPNYPELANLKIRTGTSDSNGRDYFNPAEVTKNAKKFDERVKKLQISSDDDLDDIDGPLTKSESSDELQREPSESPTSTPTMNGSPTTSTATTTPTGQMGTFTNTISSEEFQAYLERKGLALMPKRETVNSPTPTATATPTPNTTPTRQSTFLTPEERRQQIADSLAALRKSNTKKLSVLQRLSNSLFAPKRKTTPKTLMPLPRTVYGVDVAAADANKYNSNSNNAPHEMRRILLERQPMANGKLPSAAAAPKPAERNSAAAAAPAPLQRSLERQSLIPRRVSPEGQLSRFNRSASMDRNQIKLLSAQRQPPSRLESVGQRRSLAAAASASSRGEAAGERIQNYPMATSTPVRRGTAVQEASQPQAQTQAQAQPQQAANEWEQLRAIKEVTDRQLYNKVLQQQQQQQEAVQPVAQPSVENIYEHLQSQQLQPAPYFVRGSLQRNTFSGISNGRNRQVMIVDGAPITTIKQPAAVRQQQQQQQHIPQLHPQQQPPRCQSVLDELIMPSNQTASRRGYESENETPVIMRRKETSTARRIGGLLTREEILEKVKEFCRKSINRTPLSAAKMQPIYERHQSNNINNNSNNNCADISPVSYASVETSYQQHKRPASQLSSARPQVPLRVQSLPRSSFAASSASPIYAHVNKRNSLMSNDSEQYVSSQQLPQSQQQQLLTLTPSEYVIIQTEDGALQAAKLIDYHNSSSLYMQQQQLQPQLQQQQQFIRPQGYVRMEELALAQQQQQQLQQQQQQQQLQQQQQQLQQFQHLQQLQQLQNGRATPVILDRSAQQVSQIYWTPQHQRMQQQQQQQLQQGSLSLPKSPRRAADRVYPVPAPRQHLPHSYVLANGQQYATVVPSPRGVVHQQHQQQMMRNTSDWDCSSEAGEVRRIMEKSL